MKNLLYWCLFIVFVAVAIWGIPLALQDLLAVDDPMMTVTSGSMWPVLKRGDLVFVRSAELEDIQVGTMIVFHHGRGMAVHRVIRVSGNRITTKGDANPEADDPITFTDVVGRVPTIGDTPIKIPYVGNIAFMMNPETVVSQEGEPAPEPVGVFALLGRYASNPVGFILLILLPVGVLFGGTIIAFISRQSPQGRRKWRRQQMAQRLQKRWGEARAKRALGL